MPTHIPIHPSIRLSTHIYIYRSIYLPICLSIYIHTYVVAMFLSLDSLFFDSLSPQLSRRPLYHMNSLTVVSDLALSQATERGCLRHQMERIYKGSGA